MIRLKSKKEIEIMKEGGKRHMEILNTLRNSVNIGESVERINDLAEKEVKKSGGESAFLNYRPCGAGRPYPASVCVSVNEEIVHGIPNEKPKILKSGDIVSIDLGFKYKGLITDSAITVCVGKCSKEAFRLINSTEEALYKGIEAVSLGGNIGDIGYAIERYIKKSKFSNVKGLAGHGVGFEVHEDPYVQNIGRRGSGEEIVSGMVLAIEPMLAFGNGDIELLDDGFTYKTADDTLSAHFEHTVAITDDEVIVLTGQ